MPEKMVEPRTPFKRLIDAVSIALKKKGTASEASLSQKMLDLWFTNINYYHTRFDAELFECLAKDDGGSITASVDAQGACSEALRIVAQNTTMRIGNDECKTLREKFASLWAIPRSFELNSKRNDKSYARLLGKQRDIATSLDNLHDALGSDEFDESLYASFRASLEDEIAFYEELRAKEDMSPVLAFQQMLPIWIIKETSPLYELSIWEDRQSMSDICASVCEGFEAHKGEFQARDIEKRECENFTAEVMLLVSKLEKCDSVDFSPYSGMSTRELYSYLYGDGCDPTYERFPKGFPDAVILKAKLMWDLIGCSIFGPSNIIGWMAIGTEEKDGSRSFASLDLSLEAGCGSAMFRQLLAWDEDSYASSRRAFEVELGSDDYETATPDEGLVAVIGRAYSPGFTPSLQFSDSENSTLFQMAKTTGEGIPPTYFGTDLIKDSAWHLGVFLDGEPRKIYLVDLGSLNGTYVIREDDGHKHAFAFTGRDQSRPISEMADTLAKFGISEEDIEVVGYIAARRKDVLVLGDSQFEIL